MKLPHHESVPLTKEHINTLPTTAGIYIFKTDKAILYVGKSVNIKARVLSHIENSKLDPKESAIITHSTHLSFIVTDSEFNALLLESQLIKSYSPPYNSRWKDGKSYLYIKITVKDDYPKLFPVRQEDDGKSKYFGPFSSHREVETLLKEIRRVFPYCTQKKISPRPCFYAKIHLCNPCPNDIERIKDSELRREVQKKYRSNIRNIIQILSGKTELAMQSLYDTLEHLKSAKLYEDAILIRNRIERFEFLIHQRSFKQQEELDYNRSEKALTDLMLLLVPFYPDLQKLGRIECYDMSNLYAKQATASMVVATDGLADRSEYKKFKIRNVEARSDFEMLTEVLSRRLKHDWKSPDLMVIDGGKPQVRAAQKVLAELNLTTPLIGIAKRPDRFIIGIGNLPTIKPRTNNIGFNLIRNLRDESHRFAKKYHLFLREKRAQYPTS